jgi:nitroimidazol reductase NimA-like FMN-containing flavoprotein (pyridoxamine 5'-phosphate oxidase superfamily)
MDVIADSQADELNSGADIFPVNFTVKDHTIFLRSAPGSKLKDVTSHPLVAFETDGRHRRSHWSVVVKGRAERMSIDAEIEESGVLDVQTLTPSDKWNYVRITPTSVTGRSFTPHSSG